MSYYNKLIKLYNFSVNTFPNIIINNIQFDEDIFNYSRLIFIKDLWFMVNRNFYKYI